MSEMVHEHNAIDLTTWDFLVVEKLFGEKLELGKVVESSLNFLIGKLVTEIIAEQFKTSPPDIYLPCMFGDNDGQHGKPVEDPLTLDVTIALDSTGDGTVWRSTLDAIVDDAIEGVRGDTESERNLRILLRDALRKLADRVDSGIADKAAA